MKPYLPTQVAFRCGSDTMVACSEPGSKENEFPILEIGIECALILANDQAQHGTERDLVTQFIESHNAGYFDDRLQQQAKTDSVVSEHSFRRGRADIILFHQDGTATIIEAKDGTKGYTHVVSGIGQCSLYAAQLIAKPGVVRAVRRALMWTSVGSPKEDATIEDACALAGVIPLPYPSITVMMAVRAATREVIGRASQKEAEHGRTQEG